MLSTVVSATTLGLDGIKINVEVDVYKKGFPSFKIVGLPNKAVEESKDRVRTAIKNSDYTLPSCRIVVNLAPADIPKHGAIFDLPIAMGICASCGFISQDSLKQNLFIGELSLEGMVRSVPGILPIVILAKKLNIQNIFIPEHNVREASIIGGIRIFSVQSLAQVIMHCTDTYRIKRSSHANLKNVTKMIKTEVDFSEVRGQESAKRSLEISAAGGHNIHLKGPPGAGKTMLAKAFVGILPPMDEDEIIEVSKIYSVTHMYVGGDYYVNRPIRAPHHTVSRVGMTGGGTTITPGEVSLAHRGVLFLDEFPEFPRSVLEALRQPMEDGNITITRASGTYTFPSRFILLTASNPCPCGYLGHPTKSCSCNYSSILKYKKRLSGPLLDRIDLHLEVPPVKIESLVSSTEMGESSECIQKRVVLARKKALERFDGKQIKTNAEMKTAEVREFCKLSKCANDILKQAVSKFSLSARSYFKLIKVAQTITDLENRSLIREQHVLEAIQYRIEE